MLSIYSDSTKHILRRLFEAHERSSAFPTEAEVRFVQALVQREAPATRGTSITITVVIIYLYHYHYY